MANEKHLKALEKGARVWNTWRRRANVYRIDLSGADLGGGNFNGFDFARANLEGANLEKATLKNCILECALLRRANLDQANLMEAILDGANLAAASLKRANLEDALLREAWAVSSDLDELYGDDHVMSSEMPLAGLSTLLLETNLSMADVAEGSLCSAIINGAKLTETVLSGTNLGYTQFRNVDMTKAMLRGANLEHTFFKDVTLRNADFSNAEMVSTIFANVDLSEALGLHSTRHTGPSTVGVDTVYRSKGQIPMQFLQGCGCPNQFIEFVAAQAKTPIKYYSCFISYNTKDSVFCERLYSDLQKSNIRTWYFPHSAKWGEPVWSEISSTIKIYDRIIVICSRNSLISGPVLREIERALDREDKEKRNILFPIRIDDFVFEEWQHPRKRDLLTKVVGDFVGWNESEVKYEECFRRLLAALAQES